jgi:hypothetical protein
MLTTENEYYLLSQLINTPNRRVAKQIELHILVQVG